MALKKDDLVRAVTKEDLYPLKMFLSAVLANSASRKSMNERAEIL